MFILYRSLAFSRALHQLYLLSHHTGAPSLLILITHVIYILKYLRQGYDPALSLKGINEYLQDEQFNNIAILKLIIYIYLVFTKSVDSNFRAF